MCFNSVLVVFVFLLLLPCPFIMYDSPSGIALLCYTYISLLESICYIPIKGLQGLFPICTKWSHGTEINSPICVQVLFNMGGNIIQREKDSLFLFLFFSTNASGKTEYPYAKEVGSLSYIKYIN